MSQETQRLKKGQIVSHYEIIQRLGAGGMGEVYLAEDSHLGRKVALKLLLDQAESNQDFLRRFKQEARAASALNHPNIITIYQIGEWEQLNFIAMEFVEGVNLRSLVKSRQLELIEILDITIQAASALSAAHAAGIIHRDIKPENIMVRPDGLVKVLDFGLAKHAVSASPLRPDEIDSEAATREHISTIPGLVMGTAQYMSPEQARGKTVDARSDIWSLGVVLYEMITGKSPFDGETKSDTLASILKSEPDPLSLFAPDVPIELERIIKKALGKDREQRYQHIKDMLLDLRILQSELTGISQSISGIGGGGGSSSVKVLSAGSGALSTNVRKTAPLTASVDQPLETENIASPGSRRLTLIALSVFLLLAAAGAGVWYLRQPAAVVSETNFPASLASSQVTSWKSDLGEDNAGQARFSPDGRLVAYVASKNGTGGIWIKQINGGEPFTRRQDNAAESSPIWSPDGERIAYFSERGGRRGIWASPALGGSPVLIAPVESQSRLIHWTKNGAAIYFEMRQNLYTLDVASKQISKITNFDEIPIQRGFAVSPEGSERIVYADRTDGQRDLWTAEKDGSNPVRLTNDAAEDTNPVWCADGQRVVYSSNRNGVKQIWMAFLDPRRPPVQLIFSDSDSIVTDISADGTKILYTTTKDDSDLWGVPVSDGGSNKEFQVTSDIGIEFWQNVSPDGETISYQATRTASGSSKLLHSSLLTKKIKDETGQNQVTEDGFAAHWSPDGKQLAFLRVEGGIQKLWTVSAAGGDARAVTQDGVTFGGYSVLPYNRLQTQDFQWSADSRSLVYCAVRNGVSNIWQAAADAASPSERQLTNNGDKNLLFFNPMFAPDNSGRLAWLAMSIGSGEQRKSTWSIWISTPDGKTTQIYQSESLLGLLGWSVSGRELIVKSAEQATGVTRQPASVNILQVAADGDNAGSSSSLREIAKLSNAYFYNLQLSPDRKTLAFVVRAGDNDAIQVSPLATAGNAPPKTLIESSDSRVYFSNLTFAPDNKTLYYGKQANWQVVSMITNFK